MLKVVCRGAIVVLIIGEGFQDLVDLERLVLWFILVVGLLGVLGAGWIQRDLKLFNHIQNKRGIDLDLLGIHHVRVILFEYFQLNFGVCRLQLAPLSDVFGVPGMRSNIRKGISLLRIGVENFLDKVRAIPRDVFRNTVVALQNLFIQLIRVIVFKWKVAAEHGVQNDTARPYVHLEALILFARNHLRSCITWTSTRGLKPLIELIHVGEAEIDDLDIIGAFLK